MIKKVNKPNNNAHRVITFLTREELDFLDKIGKDALFSAGAKLSRSKIISALVNVIRKLDIDGKGVSSKKELENRIVKAMKNLALMILKKNNIDHTEKIEKGGKENDTVL